MSKDAVHTRSLLGRGVGGLGAGAMNLTGSHNESYKAGSPSTPTVKSQFVHSFIHSPNIHKHLLCARLFQASGDTLLKEKNFLPKLYQGSQKIKHKQSYNILRGEQCSGEK